MNPTFLFCGYGRSGKDSGAVVFAKEAGLRYGGSTSWAALPFMAHFLGVHPMQAWSERHENRQLWKDHLDGLRRIDQTVLARFALKTGEVVTGLRDKAELEAVKEAKLFTRIYWVERPGTPVDPTVTFLPEDCDYIIRNYRSLDDYHKNIRDLARREMSYWSLTLSGNEIS